MLWPLAEKKVKPSISHCDISNKKLNLLYYLQGGKELKAPDGTPQGKQGCERASGSSCSNECFFVPEEFCIQGIADSIFLFSWCEHDPDPDLTQANSFSGLI